MLSKGRIELKSKAAKASQYCRYDTKGKKKRQKEKKPEFGSV